MTNTLRSIVHALTEGDTRRELFLPLQTKVALVRGSGLWPVVMNLAWLTMPVRPAGFPRGLWL
jgi:hypothetical protein